MSNSSHPKSERDLNSRLLEILVSTLNEEITDPDRTVYLRKFCERTVQVLATGAYQLFDAHLNVLSASRPDLPPLNASFRKRLDTESPQVEKASTGEYGTHVAFLLSICKKTIVLDFYLPWTDVSWSTRVDHPTSVLHSGLKELIHKIEQADARTELQNNLVEIRNAQSALIQSEKLASIGTIAAGIAHEINNPLSFILSNLETLALYHQKVNSFIVTAYSSSNPELESLFTELDLDYIIQDQTLLIGESIEGVKRISEIVKSLKTFSRSDDLEDQYVDLNECVQAALRVASNELKYKAEVIKDLGPVPTIKMSSSHLLQVVMNILINAAQAIEKQGRVQIKTYAQDGYVYLEVEDSGSGMSAETQQKLFTPFFTTKPIGKGTGLGLSVSYGIIKKANGDIQFRSQVGKGTTFLIKLPATPMPHESGV